MAVAAAVITLQQDGMNAAIHAAYLTEGAFARGINVSIRGGHIHTRPGFHMFSSDIVDALTPETGLFQGASVWRTQGGTFLATVYSGYVRLTDLETGTTEEVGAYLASTGTVHIVQAGPYLVFHGGGSSFLAIEWDEDGSTWAIKKTPLIPESMVDDSWDTRMQSITLAADVAARMEADAGLSYDDALAAALAAVLAEADVPSYPPGTVCCFAYGRIHISSDALGHRYFYSSDFMPPSDNSSVLKWWENSFLNSGGGLGLPDALGEIRGMAVLQNSGDTASGLGPLIVLAQEGAAAFSVHLPREGVFNVPTSQTGVVSPSASLVSPGWKDQQIGQVLFYGGGTESPWSLARVNGDLLYRSTDGLRTIKHTMSVSSGSLVSSAPISSELTPFIEYDTTPAALTRVSAAACDNRVLVTAARHGDAGHRGLLSLDLCVLAALKQEALQAYDGMWTGVDVGKVMAVDGRFLLVATDGRLYWIVPGSRWDYVDGARRNIECQWMTRQSDLGQPGFKKRLEYVDLWLRDMEGDVEADVYYRPDNFAWWTKMDGSVSLSLPTYGIPQERRRLRFRVAATRAPTYDGSLVCYGDTFQFLVVWRGDATVQRLSISANVETETPPRSIESCDFSHLEVGDDQIVQNDFSYPEGF